MTASRRNEQPGSDLHHLLGLDPGASSAEITRAYRRLARLYHPDVDTTPGAPGETPDCLKGRVVTMGRRMQEIGGARSERRSHALGRLAARSPPHVELDGEPSRSVLEGLLTHRGGERCRVPSAVPGRRSRWAGPPGTSLRHRSCPGVRDGSAERRRGGRAGGTVGHSAAMIASNSAATSSASEQTSSTNSSSTRVPASRGSAGCWIVVMVTSDTSLRRQWPAGRLRHW